MICFLLMIAVLGIYIYRNNYHNKRDDYRCPLCHGRSRMVSGGYLCCNCGHFERMGRE